MMDLILEAWVSGSIERAKAGWMLGEGKRWQPGEKLKLLFAGYNGTRNMGSDVRVEEMLRQVRHILGAERVEFSVMSQNFDFSRGYFEGTKQVHLPDIFPPFLANRSGAVGKGASLMKVFMPYLVWNTVFDNRRVTVELGKKPVAFSEYCYPLLKFSRENNFAYKYKPWPAAAGGTAA